MCRYYPLQEIGKINAQRTSVEEHDTDEFAHALTRMSYPDWQQIDTARLGILRDRYRVAEERRVRYWNSIRDIRMILC
jgi:hypothetical protein